MYKINWIKAQLNSFQGIRFWVQFPVWIKLHKRLWTVNSTLKAFAGHKLMFQFFKKKVTNTIWAYDCSICPCLVVSLYIISHAVHLCLHLTHLPPSFLLTVRQLVVIYFSYFLALFFLRPSKCQSINLQPPTWRKPPPPCPKWRLRSWQLWGP